MRTVDLLRLSFGALGAHRLRSALTATGVGVGIAAVVILTSFGEGLHRFVLSEFTQFGTNLLAVTPGKTSTMGISGAIMNSVRPLAIDDAQAIAQLPRIEAAVPMVIGNASVESGRRSRRATVFGVGHRMTDVWKVEVAVGSFLPDDDPASARAFAVLGYTMRQELFGARSPLGEIVRIGGSRFRVVGALQEKGQFLGFDLDDSIYIPAGRGLELFNRDGLMEVDVLFAEGAEATEIGAIVSRLLIARHGREDFTIVIQEQMLDVLDSVLSVLTFAVGALGGMSLLVAGVGILTIMTIAIQERTAEIGLLRALGATRAQVTLLFLSESASLSALGGLLGLAAGLGVAGAIHVLVPALPVHPSPVHAVIAEVVAILIGIIAGVAPAIRAAGLNPVESLRAE
jgi:putative ABC transport system permease protein